ncbi:PH domain-containing protein [Candidatus Berkelbacteria bacterium]|nr:PH domain-containing protein [Candidatus Berkelbacteria bacterium]
MSHLIDTEINSHDPAFLYLNLHTNEEIKLVVRHHWAGFLGTLLLVVGMGLFPLFILFAVNLTFKDSIDQYMPIISVAITGFYLFLLTFLFGAWINYYYDIIFITNERIVNVAQEGLLSRKTSELNLRQVENVTAEVEGFLQTALNYGILVIETAGEGTTGNIDKPGIKGFFTVTDVPDPNRLARVILEFHRNVVSSTDNN